jgi:hypothetical protein
MDNWVELFIVRKLWNLLYIVWTNIFFIISLTFFLFTGMRVKHGEDPSTHPKYNLELWFEVGATSGPNNDYDIWYKVRL